MSATTLETALSISEAIGAAVASLSASDEAEVEISATEVVTCGTSEAVTSGSVTIRLSTADAMSSMIEGRTDAPVGRVALMPTSNVTFRPVGAAMSEIQVDATTGTVSTV